MDRPHIKQGVSHGFVAACIAALNVIYFLTLLALGGCEAPWVIPPGPTPDPTPIVVPVAGEVFVYVVEETGERSTETALTLNGSSEWWHKLGSRNVVYRWYDDDQCPPSVAAAVKERPGLLVLDKSAKILHRGPLPKSTAGIDSLLKGLGK